MLLILRTFVVLLVVAAMTLLLALPIWLATRTGWYRAGRLIRLWHRTAAWALGFRIHKTERTVGARPLLLVANHVSWSDIVVLGAVADVSFIARSEVAGWPFVGWLARMQRTVFVERDEKRRSREQADAIAARLATGDVLVLFAEGTTGDGNIILPFKTSLFGSVTKLAGERPVVVQPVTLAYTRLYGLPLGRRGRPLVSWVGDQDLWPHMRGLLARPAVDVEVHFGEPIAVSSAPAARKDIARAVEAEVRRQLSVALSHPRPSEKALSLSAQKS